MAGSTSGGGGALSAQAAAALGEGIGLVFGRWTALQMAVENQWGGRDSRAKADQLAESILSWFANSKGILVFFLSPPCNIIIICYYFLVLFFGCDLIQVNC
jgi:pre-rRNA-processing protein TSR2